MVDLSPSERSALNSAPFSDEQFRKSIANPKLYGEASYTTLERLGVRPCFDINGIWGGYAGKGAKTVLPAKAGAKISFRIVPNQKGDDITQKTAHYIKKILPDTISAKIDMHHSSNPAALQTNSTAYMAWREALEGVWHKKPVPLRCGGSIPIVALFEDILGQAPILMGFGLPEDGLHAPNESFAIDNFFKGIEATIAFHNIFAKKSS